MGLIQTSINKFKKTQFLLKLLKIQLDIIYKLCSVSKTSMASMNTQNSIAHISIISLFNNSMAANSLETAVLKNHKILVISSFDSEKMLDSQELPRCGQAHERRSVGRTLAEDNVQSS